MYVILKSLLVELFTLGHQQKRALLLFGRDSRSFQKREREIERRQFHQRHHSHHSGNLWFIQEQRSRLSLTSATRISLTSTSTVTYSFSFFSLFRGIPPPSSNRHRSSRVTGLLLLVRRHQQTHLDTDYTRLFGSPPSSNHSAAPTNRRKTSFIKSPTSTLNIYLSCQSAQTVGAIIISDPHPIEIYSQAE
jgi:hypothetical protein